MLFTSGVFSVLSQIFMVISYVSSKNTFPKPLTLKEEQEYLIKMSNGDINAKNILIESNLRLVAHIAKKYSMCDFESDDLISIGTIGLIKAISSFDVKKGTRLATYAARCIENEILMVLRSSKKLQNEVSINEPIGTDKEGNEISLMDIVDSGEEIVEKVNVKMEIAKLYDSMKRLLKDREKLVLKLRFGLDNTPVKTQREIAKMLGISRSYVSRLESKAINKLKNDFS